MGFAWTVKSARYPDLDFVSLSIDEIEELLKRGKFQLMILIMSGAYVDGDLATKLTAPAFSPFGNKGLYEHQVSFSLSCSRRETKFFSLTERLRHSCCRPWAFKRTGRQNRAC